MFILIWSAAASKSEWVQKEWGAANSCRKKIIPCLLDETKLPSLLADKVYVDFRDFNKGMNELLHALRFSKQVQCKQHSHSWS